MPSFSNTLVILNYRLLTPDCRLLAARSLKLPLIQKMQVKICSYEKFPTLGYMKETKKHNSVPEPTRSELEILQVLWQHGPSTVRFVNDILNEQKREVQYTSTLKLMQIMADKGLLTRDESNMKHIYSAAEEETRTKEFLLERFVNTMYNGSASKLMMQLLGNKKTSKKEIETIKELIKKLDK